MAEIRLGGAWTAGGLLFSARLHELGGAVNGR
jgi:hypothetical protein